MLIGVLNLDPFQYKNQYSEILKPMDSRLQSSLQNTLKSFYLIVGDKQERFKAKWKQFEQSLNKERKDLLSTFQHHDQTKAQTKKPQLSDELSPKPLLLTNLSLPSPWPNDFTFRFQNCQLYSSPNKRIIKNKFKSDSLEKTVLFALVFNHYFLCNRKKPIQHVNTIAAQIFESIRQAMTNCAIQFKQGTSKDRLRQLQVILSLVGRQGESLNEDIGEFLNEKIESLDNDYVVAVFNALGVKKNSLILPSKSADFQNGYLSQIPKKPINDLSLAAESLGIRIKVYEDNNKYVYGKKSSLCCININKSTWRQKYTLKDIICYSQQDSSDDANQTSSLIHPQQARLTTSI